MSRLFLLAHSRGRLESDFFPTGTHVTNPPCSACEYNLNRMVAPLRYFWEYEYGDPQASVDAGLDCYWGQLYWMVTPHGRSILERLRLSVDFSPALAEGELPGGVEPSNVFFWVTPRRAAAADPVASRNEVCEECGNFVERRRPIARVHVPRSSLPACGIFTIRQNASSGPIFVTEQTRDQLSGCGLTGLGFYVSGNRVID